MLSDTALAALCVVQTFHTFLQHFDQNIVEDIDNYVQIVQLVRGFEELLSQFTGQLAGQYWSVLTMPIPQVGPFLLE